MRVATILFFLFFITPFTQVSAQAGSNLTDITGENISITLDPQYPNPGDTVRATIDDYALGGVGSTITWFFDGLSSPNVTNNRTITFTAPAVGVSMEITAQLRFADGRTLDARRTITPLYLDIIIEPQTYTPVFYKGRALPTKGSLVNMNALLQNKTGIVNSQNYSYTWSLNNKSIYGGARVGGNWAQINVPHGKSNVITISIQDRSGTTVARKLVAIPTVDLEIQFYELNTLLGLQQKAITGELIITGNSSSIKAIPYYLDTRAVNNNIFTQWRLDNQVVATESNDPFEINLVRGISGSVNVGFKIRNLNELLQSDERAFQVKL